MSGADVAWRGVKEEAAALAAYEACSVTACEATLRRAFDAGSISAGDWIDTDQPIPEDDAIAAAHPLKTGRHDLYEEASRMVGAKRSKFALVDLANWLLARHDEVLHECESHQKVADRQRDAAMADAKALRDAAKALLSECRVVDALPRQKFFAALRDLRAAVERTGGE